MKSMHILLDEAEEAWRREVKQDFPLRSDTPVIKDSKKAGGRDWIFSTDLQRIFASIGKDEELQRKFKDIVTKYWDGTPEGLAKEVLHYLLFHELYHPLEAPFSVSGPDNDNKRIHQAMRRGMLKAQPKLTPLEQIVKVQASENGVKDFVLDNRFFLDNLKQGYVRSDIIPVWDLLELQDSPTKTDFYTVTRLLYGLLYGPEKTHEFFGEKAGRDGYEVAERAISTLLGKSVKLQDKKGLVGTVLGLIGAGTESKAKDRLPKYPADIRGVFSGPDRYSGIERFMEVLGPYVQQGMPQGRPEMHSGEGGASPQTILQDLLEDMSADEQNAFTAQLAQQNLEDLVKAGTSLSNAGLTPHNIVSEMKNLDVLAAHEFYKRNHPNVKIVGSGKEGQSLVVGQQQYWDLKRSTTLTQDQLGRLDLRKIDALQRKTRLPWLIEVGNGTYVLNEYALETRDLKAIQYVDKKIAVPDATEIYVDSSGSMFGGSAGKFGLNDGSRWDMLSHVVYGFADALMQGGRQVGAKPKIRFHNFANQQVSSPLIPVEQFWKGDVETSRVLFRPDNGYDHEDINITQFADGAKRAYIVVTDGDLVIDGRTAREAAKMRKLARNPLNHVALFEIGGTYGLGRAVQGQTGIAYHPVHNKEEMLAAGLEVLLSK